MKLPQGQIVYKKNHWHLMLVIAAAMVLASCGGGSGSVSTPDSSGGTVAVQTTPTSPAAPTTTVPPPVVSTPSTTPTVTPPVVSTPPTTPTVTPPAGASAKISNSKRLYASTTEDSSKAPANAADGNMATRWASGAVEKAWLMMDLGIAARIDRVEIDWETAWSSKFTIEVSNDRATWVQAGTQVVNRFIRQGTDAASTPAELKNSIPLNLTQAYRYVRVNSTERGWADTNNRKYGISILEFNVFGAGGQDNPPPIPGPAVPTAAAYSLVWSDDFDSGGTKVAPDPVKWGYDLGNGCDIGKCGWGNNELQYYTNSTDNVFLQNGLLNIQLRKDIPINAKPAYTSGRITTRGKYELAYGRIVGRIKMVTQTSSANGAKDGPVGVWGGFWTLGTDVNDPYVGWPYSGEQDIMENIGYSWWYSSSLHGPGYSGGGSVGISYNKIDTPTGITADSAITTTFSSTDWHEYEVEWEPNTVTFKLDGKITRTLSRADVEKKGPWVYDKPNFILLNLAYGGDYPNAYKDNPKDFTGAKTAAGLSQLAENNFPYTMQVDWIRVFQRK